MTSTILDDSDYIKEPYLGGSVQDIMHEHKLTGFEDVKRDLDQHLETFDRLQTIEEERSKYQQYITDPEPEFNNFLSTHYTKYGRDYPEKINGNVQRAVLQTTANQVGFMRNNLKNELRDLKIFTIIDKLNGNTDEIERDVVSLHSEMPKYFSKPRLYGQVLPEVLKNKNNLITALRGIKSREEKREKQRTGSYSSFSKSRKPFDSSKVQSSSSPGFTRNMLKSALTSPTHAAILVDPRRVDPPSDMFSRSFMYIKMHQPNMRLDISQPKSTFEIPPGQKGGRDLVAAQAAIPPVITQNDDFVIENQDNSNTQQEVQISKQIEEYKSEKKSQIIRDLHTSQTSQRLPFGSNHTLKIKSDQLQKFSQLPPRGQTPSIEDQQLDTYKPQIPHSSSTSTLTKSAIKHSFGNLQSSHLLPHPPFSSFAPPSNSPVPGHNQPSSQQTLIYNNAPQFVPQTMGLSPNTLFNTQFQYSKSSGEKLRPSKSPSKNQDQSGYYENKMLKPLQKEKSLLQKLYRESLQTSLSPQKIPKIKQQDFNNQTLNTTNQVNPNDHGTLQIGVINLESNGSPQSNHGGHAKHLHQTFGGNVVHNTRFLVHKQHHYRLDGRTIKNIVNGHGNLKALVKIPTIESVRSNATHSSTGSQLYQQPQQLKKEFLF